MVTITATSGETRKDPNKWTYPPDGSRLCKINLRTKKLKVIFEVKKGGISAI